MQTTTDTDPRDTVDAIGELPHTLYEEEATLEILMQCGILVFQSADANGAFFEQVYEQQCVA